ncbi:MAG: ABC-F family ATP-binding cassette domain-containing protein [Clostridium sp.]
MIKVENLSYSFPQKDLFNKISFTIEEGQHCAFIGTNGSGKSTLIDIIMDPEKYLYDGKLEIANNCRIGYVSQFSKLDETNDLSVFEYIAEEHIKLQNEIARICSEMETSSDIETLLEKYQEALDAFEAINGDDFENIINKQLSLVDLAKYKDAKASNLSGGEFKLIQVIKAMLNSPDIMIMDEPDVFLDFGNLNSLKNLINSHKGTILVITHNRYLLNHCFNKIIHLEDMQLQEFNGGYIDYNLSLLQTKIEVQELSVADDIEIERNAALIDKFRKRATEDAEAARGRTLNARVKIQERLEKRRIKPPFIAIKEPNINLVIDNVLEETTALKVSEYGIAFKEPLLENVNFEINSNDKVAIIGPNGSGKTTLIKEIFKNASDAIEINEDVNLAYLSQIQSTKLNENNTVLDEFMEAGFHSYDEVKYYISNYDFNEEIINQKIGDLSGGEKNILQLAKMSISKANMLLLDEPTSHLDTYSQIALEKAIKNYNGAILMVSHDFYSIANCMDYVLIIEDKSVRRMNIKKFKKMIYANYFDRDYLELEQSKKNIETKIELSLKAKDFEAAKVLAEELEGVIKQLQK